ncbi:RNA polymerase sigma factor [Chitinophaga sp. NPDC101104]|uniref:RNA polymerase sigma factor n=1 Tax=Chitinophaga sp. NPDC101104 TaxID=3390561 RepID=UPI003CFD9857
MPVSQNYDENALLQRIADGDERAFGVLFSHYYPRLFPLVHRFSLTDTDVQEALQETFIQVWLHRDRLPEIANLQGWLLRIASRRCRELLRKHLLQERTIAGAALAAEEEVADTPSHHMQGGELRRLVQETLDGMPEQRRKIYIMSRELGLKPAEIAQQLSLSVSTVKNTLVTALKQMRTRLEESGYIVCSVSVCCKIFLFTIVRSSSAMHFI